MAKKKRVTVKRSKTREKQLSFESTVESTYEEYKGLIQKASKYHNRIIHDEIDKGLFKYIVNEEYNRQRKFDKFVTKKNVLDYVANNWFTTSFNERSGEKTKTRKQAEIDLKRWTDFVTNKREELEKEGINVADLLSKFDTEYFMIGAFSEEYNLIKDKFFDGDYKKIAAYIYYS